MKLIRKRRNGYALSFAVSICLAVAWHGIYVRSSFRLWDYQPTLSPAIDERAVGSMLQRSFGITASLRYHLLSISMPGSQMKKTLEGNRSLPSDPHRQRNLPWGIDGYMACGCTPSILIRSGCV